MPGLPHFTNSLAATKYYEPFYQNLFEVSILPPPTVAGGEILLEHVRKIGGLTEQKMEATCFAHAASGMVSEWGTVQTR